MYMIRLNDTRMCKGHDSFSVRGGGATAPHDGLPSRPSDLRLRRDGHGGSGTSAAGGHVLAWKSSRVLRLAGEFFWFIILRINYIGAITALNQHPKCCC